MWHISYCHHVEKIEEFFTAPLHVNPHLKKLLLSVLWIFRSSIIIRSFINLINLPPQNFVRTSYYRLLKIKITNFR
jgi:hypothetical protein